MKIDTTNATIDTIIFDLDGTLYDKKSLGYHFITNKCPKLNWLAKSLVARNQLRGIDFRDSIYLFSELFRKINKNSRTIKKVNRWYFKDFYPTFIAILKKYYKKRPDSDVLFKTLNENGIHTAVYSDFGKIKERLEALEINPTYFDLLVSSEDYGVLKPHTRPVQRILDHFNTDPANALIIGDKITTDGECAKMSGTNFMHIQDSKRIPDAVTWQECHNYLMGQLAH